MMVPYPKAVISVAAFIAAASFAAFKAGNSQPPESSPSPAPVAKGAGGNDIIGPVRPPPSTTAAVRKPKFALTGAVPTPPPVIPPASAQPTVTARSAPAVPMRFGAPDAASSGSAIAAAPAPVQAMALYLPGPSSAPSPAPAPAPAPTPAPAPAPTSEPVVVSPPAPTITPELVGVELAQMFSRAGVKVTLVFRSRLLPEMEPEIGAALTDYLSSEGIAVHGTLAYQSVRKTAEGDAALTVLRDGVSETIVAERLLVATGRTPNVEDLGLPEAGVAQTPSGAILVDDHMRTSMRGVYAAGDVTGRDQFVYMAAYGAKIAAKNALNGDSLRYDNSAMPAVVFSDPQVASVGLTEAQAIAAGHEARTSILPLENVPRALAARDTRGLIKLVADGSTRKLLGAHILAPEGADSIQTAAMAIRCGLTIDDLAGMIFPYLTTVEGLKLAAQTFDRDVSRLSCCAG